MKPYFSLLFAILLTTFPALAHSLSPDEALAAALASSRLKAPSTEKYLLRHTATISDGTPGFYVFSRGEGILIASADSRFQPLLGYSDRCDFSEEDLPDGLQYLLDEYKREMAYALAHNLPESQHKISAQAYGPLLSCNWDQLDPYNRLTPSGTPTGCAATAMAQIMHRHQWPQSFDWSSMLPKYEYNEFSQDQANAVAELMSACGQAVKMIYGYSQSLAFSYDVPAAFCSMGYSKADLRIMHRDYFENEQFMAQLYEELAAGRPVYYSGQGSSGGHAFVLDGSDSQGLFHFNWGWSGKGDGYYSLSALRPSGTGIGANGGDYSYNQCAIMGITPGDGSGVEKYPQLIGCGDFAIGSQGFETVGGTVSGFWNSSIDGHEFGLGVMFEDRRGNQYWPADESSKYLRPGEVCGSFYNVPDPDRLPAGAYTAYPVFKTEYTPWARCPLPYYAINSLNVNVDGGGLIRFEGQKQSSLLSGFEWVRMTEPDEPFTVSFNAINSLGGRARAKYTLRVADRAQHYYFDFDAREQRSLELTFEHGLGEGEYSVEFIENDGDVLLTLPFRVKHNPKIPITAEYFPDAVFRAYVGSACDSDRDGLLSLIEIEKTSYLILSGVSSLDGLDRFNYITGLNISNSPDLTSLDLSGNPLLTSLTCTKSSLASLDLSHTPLLTNLLCNDNRLTELDLSPLKELEEVDCSGNQLTALSLCGLPKLSVVRCNDNQLAEIDASGCRALTSLYAPHNSLRSINLSDCGALNYLNLFENQFENIDFTDCASLESLYLTQNSFHSIDLSPLASLKLLDVSNNFLTILDLSQNPALENLYASSNRLPFVDLSANSSLTYAMLLGNAYPLDFEDEIDLNRVPCFDISRASSFTAYYYDAATERRTFIAMPKPEGNIVKMPEGANQLSYIYDTGSPAVYAEFSIRRATASNGVVNIEQSGLEINVVGRELRIKSPHAQSLTLVSVDGRVLLLQVGAGENAYTLPAPGIYILGGKKLVVR